MNTTTYEPHHQPAGDAAAAALRAALLRRLAELDYLAFERVVCRLLAAMGYGRVHMLGRRHLARGSNGGADIEAAAVTGVSAFRVLVQAKQYPSAAVPARYVYELLGVSACRRAHQGIIVSTSPFSPVAVAAAKASPLVPIRLIGGDALARLLVRYRIGVRPALRVVLDLDEAFFAGLAGNAD